MNYLDQMEQRAVTWTWRALIALSMALVWLLHLVYATRMEG